MGVVLLGAGWRGRRGGAKELCFACVHACVPCMPRGSRLCPEPPWRVLLGSRCFRVKVLFSGVMRWLALAAGMAWRGAGGKHGSGVAVCTGYCVTTCSDSLHMLT